MRYHSADFISAAWLFFSFSKECAGIYHAGLVTLQMDGWFWAEVGGVGQNLGL